MKLIDKQTYGWSEFLAPADCASTAEVARFYERQGGYLALLYALDASDFHYENILAVGEHPLLIDLEALFHPHLSRISAYQSPAQRRQEHSVLRIALLPMRMFLNEEGEGMDISGLARVAGQLSPRPVAQWEGTGTDEMKLIRKRLPMQEGHNLPRLHGQEVQPLDYLEPFINGFIAMYRLLVSNSEEIQTSMLPHFAKDEIRFVARATAFYSLLLTESFHPNMLRDALKRERFFDRLWMEVEYQPSLARLIPAERADLLQGDIPIFTTTPMSRDLWTSRGACLPGFFDESSLDVVKQRLQRLSETDLQRQLWLIRASFTNHLGQREAATQSSIENRYMLPTSQSVDREDLLAEARAIGDRLAECAVQEEGYADWLGLTWVRERDWQISESGLDLSSGLPGIILFLSYLGHVTGEASYTALARAGLNTLRMMLAPLRTSADQRGIGGFTGLGSCLYLYAHLAVLWHDPSLVQEAEELLPLLARCIDKDERFDLVDGAAGCLANLLTLYAIAPSRHTLMAALQCGEHLLAHAQTMPEGLGWKTKQQEALLVGFAHGTAGIAWSLFRMAEVTEQERFRDAALGALAYEQSLFSPQQGHRHDLGKRAGEEALQHDEVDVMPAPPTRCGMSWRQGTPGIALGRFACLPYLNDARIRAELEVALDTTLNRGFGYTHEQVGPNHSLFHGDCGNLEAVLLAAQTFQTPQWQEHLQRLTVHLLESKHRHGWVMGVPGNIETPGLLFGLAGIGYQCLRLAEPEGVPSVLILAPPSSIVNW